jgi:hypothetical protein
MRLARLTPILFPAVAVSLALLQAVANRHAMGSDGVSYLDMADRVEHGDWPALINGHWSPLYPLLIAAGLKLVQPSPWNEAALMQAVHVAIFLLALAAYEFFARQWFRLRPDWALRITGYALFIWATIRVISVKLTSPDLLLAATVFLAAGFLLRPWERTRLACAAGLGATLGVGYWAKSPMFVLTFLFIALIPIAAGRRRSIPLLAFAFGAFAAIALPLVVLQSNAQGHLSFSEVGKTSYAWYVNHTREFHGREAAHPTRQLFTEPPAYEFAAPIGGTYPLWFDPSYWNAGVTPRFNLNQQLDAIGTNLPVYADLFIGLPAVLLAAAMAAGLQAGANPDRTTVWLLLAPALAAFGLYALVHAEPRFFAPFAALATLAGLAAVGFDGAFDRRWLAALAITGCALSLARPTGRDLAALLRGRAYPEREVAAGLQAIGLQPGDRVAVTSGAASHGKWARPARLRITAEVDATNSRVFWSTDAETQRQLLEQFSRTGVRALIADAPPREALPAGWQRVGATSYYAFLFPR